MSQPITRQVFGATGALHVKTPDWPEIILKGLEGVLWLFRAIQIPSEVVPFGL
jgi:hypothetical protein